MNITFTDESVEVGYEVEFMSLTVDKADNLTIIDSDSHFSDFSGVHPSKIKQGKITLHDILKPIDRERVMKAICKENARFVYLDFDILNKKGEPVFVHCTGQNIEYSTYCSLTLADVSKNRAKQEKLKAKATEINELIDLVNAGVCLFKVYENMHIEALYANEGLCRLFKTTKENFKMHTHRIDEFIHSSDKSTVFQAVGKCMATGEPIDMECRIIIHKDEYLWCKIDAAIQRMDDDGCPIFHAIFTDITRIKDAEKKADDESEKLVRLFKNLPGAVFFTYAKSPFKLEIVSEEFMAFTGYKRVELFEFFGGNFSKIIDEKEAENVTQYINENIQNNRELTMNYTIKTANNGDLKVQDKRIVITHDDSSRVLVGMITPQ